MSFASLPYFVAQPYARNKILNSIALGYSGVRRWLLLGDSQETAPGGSGSVYIPTLSRALQPYYGNRVETGWLPQTSYGSGSPPALFLSRGTINGQTPVNIPTELLPGFSLLAYNNAANGTLWMSLPDGSLLNAASPTRQWYQDVVGNLQFEILCKGSTTGGSEFAWTYRTPATNVPSYFSPSPTASGTSSLSLDADNNFKKQIITVAQDATNRYGQIGLKGASATAIQICSCRIRHENAIGISITAASAGGYKVGDVLANHANAGPFASAIGPFDLVVLQFGANDSANSVTSAQYKTNVLALIAAMRGWLGVDQTFLIVPDIARTGLTGDQETALEDYNLSAKEITDTDANVAFLNLRRLTNDRFGWTSAGGSWLSDSVHLTSEAQVRLGELFVTYMMGLSDSDNAAVLSKLSEIQIDVRNLTQ
jgi:lysophospholipase L1-like esterase